MTSLKKIEANRANAQKSTGPRTLEGKAVSRKNALRHGVRAEAVTVEGEDASGFEALRSALFDDLRPVGALEEMLVEKISLAFWRNRRLAAAEAAAARLRQRPNEIGAWAAQNMSGSFSRSDFNDLEPVSEAQRGWCATVIAEAEDYDGASLDELKRRAPSVYVQLEGDAKEDGETVIEYLQSTSVADYVSELARWCRREIQRADSQPDRVEAYNQLRSQASIALIDKQVLFARYQTMLDGQLLKGLKALQEAQERRLASIGQDNVVDVNDATFEGT